jgi:hypothetical protein
MTRQDGRDGGGDGGGRLRREKEVNVYRTLAGPFTPNFDPKNTQF